MLSDDQPIFNLRAVVKETGVKPDTLRAWERRYGLPQPQRTEGGHRLYSRKDIKTIQWLLAQRDAGLSISKAVGLWHELESDAETGAPAADLRVNSESSRTDDEDTYSQLREAWVSATLRFDEGAAQQALSEAFAVFPVERVCTEVLLAGIRRLGQGWYDGDVTVQQEHFASGLAMRQLQSLTNAAPPPTRSGRILAACPPQEDHVFSLMLLTLFLRRRGWDVVNLGANVPINHIADTIRSGDFQLVLSSAQQLQSAAALAEMAAVLYENGTPLVYGGRIFNLLPALRDRIPGTFLGERLENAVQVIENAMVAQPSPVAPDPIAAELLVARQKYQEHLPAIDSDVEKLLADSGIPYAQIARANRNMGEDISSALALGDMSFLGNEIAWVQGLLENHSVEEQLLDRYLDAYAEAVERRLNGNGSPIVEWLEQLS